MAGKPQANKYVIERVLNKGWEYLDKNFENFSTHQKIQIALDLCKRCIPDQKNVTGTQMPNVVVNVVNNGERRKLRSDRKTKLSVSAPE